MKWFFFFIFLKPYTAFACSPTEVHIRGQWIDGYIREDGTKVSAHFRTEHCREIGGSNSFQDSSSKEFINFKGKFKAWNASEKNQLTSELDKLPGWLRRYKTSNFLRATVHEFNPKNPALVFPDSKTIILFDSYFVSPNKKIILLHEMSHIAAWDIDPAALQDFFVSNGWIYERGKLPAPPKKVIIPDSVYSPSEDFANSVEMYYSSPKKLKEFNPQSFLILERIIKSKESQ